MIQKTQEAMFLRYRFEFLELYVEQEDVKKEDLRVGQKVRIIDFEGDIDTTNDDIGRKGILDSSETPRNYKEPDLIIINDEEAVLLKNYKVEPY